MKGLEVGGRSELTLSGKKKPILEFAHLKNLGEAGGGGDKPLTRHGGSEKSSFLSWGERRAVLGKETLKRGQNPRTGRSAKQSLGKTWTSMGLGKAEKRSLSTGPPRGRWWLK